MPVEAPKVGNTVEEGMVGEGRRHKGDRVTAGEVISEIETDKTTCEIAAPVSGTIMEVFFTQGSLVPVFTTLCIIGAAERGKNRGGSGGESGIALKRLALVDQIPGQQRLWYIQHKSTRFERFL